MARRRERLRDRLNRPGRTAMGRLIRGAIKIAKPAASVAGMVFPGAVPLVVGAAARIRAAKQHVRDRVQARKTEVEKSVQAQEQGQPGAAVRTYASVLGFFQRLPIWVWLGLIVVVVFFIFRPSRLKKRISGAGTPGKKKSAPQLMPGRKRKAVGVTTGGFSRRIGSVVYNNPKAWAAEMQRRRKRK